MGIILMLVCLGYLVGAAILLVVTRKLTKSKRIFALVALALILFPFRRLIFYEALFAYYERTPLQEIRQTVDSPVSVYWEDNVWPGFDEYGRHWMVKNYLDGVHLQALALNGDDGKIYLYRATKEDFAESAKLLAEVERLEAEHEALKVEAKQSSMDRNDPLWVKSRNDAETTRVLRWERYEPQKEREVAQIIDRAEIHQDITTLPAMNYRVKFNPLPKSLVVNNDYKILHADRISIIDTRANQEIAFSRRYMAHTGLISQISGQQPKFDYELGDIQVYEFDDKVLFGYTGLKNQFESVRARFRRSSYDLLRLGWERKA